MPLVNLSLLIHYHHIVFMDIGQLQAFVTVAELQSFSKAAQRLHLTQSAVSKRIVALESFVDIALFERFGPRIRLTNDLPSRQ